MSYNRRGGTNKHLNHVGQGKIKGDALLPVCLPFEQNVRCVPSMHVSNTWKRETRVLGARCILGPVH
jgi:hypothetical protein